MYAQDTLSHSTKEWENANSILTKLCRAAGDTFAPPRLCIKNDSNLIAKHENATPRRNYHQIVIGLKAYRLCETYGNEQSKGALAFLLGHELSHYYNKKNAQFACIFHELTETSQQDTLAEMTADIQGHYYARLAGYASCNIGERLISGLYNSFRLGNNPKYPILATRQNKVITACQSADTLIDIYECAIFASLLGEYNMASDLYAHLLTTFQSREVYCASAVQKLLYIREKLIEKTEWKYEFPLSFDFQNRFRQFENQEEDVLLKLKEAENLLIEALKREDNYLLAQYYLLYTQHLKIIVEQPQDATTQQALLLEKLHNVPLSSSTYLQEMHLLLEGILFHFVGEKAKGIAVWGKITHDIPTFYVAAQNNIQPEENEIPPCKGYFSDKLKQDICTEMGDEEIGSLLNLPNIQVKIADNSLFLISQNGHFLQLSRKNISQQKLPFSSYSEMLQLYGLPCKTLSMIDNKMLFFYYDSKVIFVFEGEKAENSVCYEIW